MQYINEENKEIEKWIENLSFTNKYGKTKRDVVYLVTSDIEKYKISNDVRYG